MFYEVLYIYRKQAYSVDAGKVFLADTAECDYSSLLLHNAMTEDIVMAIVQEEWR